MSQAKVDQYKKEKANRKKTMAKDKAKSIIAKICGTIVGIALVAWIGVSAVYFVIDNRLVNKFFVQTDALENFFDELYEEETEAGTETTEKEESKTDSTESTEDSTEKTDSTEKK